MYKTDTVTMLANPIPKYLTLAARGHSRSNLPSLMIRVIKGALHLSMSMEKYRTLIGGTATSRTLSLIMTPKSYTWGHKRSLSTIRWPHQDLLSACWASTTRSCLPATPSDSLMTLLVPRQRASRSPQAPLQSYQRPSTPPTATVPSHGQ